MPTKICISIATLFVAVSAFGQTAESIELAKNVPIADVHMHVYHFTDVSFQIEQMKINNVRYGGGVGDYQSGIAEFLGKRYISAIGQPEFSYAFRRSREQGITDVRNFVALFENAEEMFAKGTAKGFGEIHSNNSIAPSTAAMQPRKIRLRSPVIERMYQIANKHKGFVQVHAQYDGEFEDDLHYFSKQYPNTLTVLSHCLSMSQTHTLDKFFSDLPNVVCEISANDPIHSNVGNKRRPRVFTADGPRKEWMDLIQKHPTRIMLGTDPCCGLLHRYSEMIVNLRTMFLPYFEPEIIEKLAYKNAVHWFKLEEEPKSAAKP